jgi:hypothetical protein
MMFFNHPKQYFHLAAVPHLYDDLSELTTQYSCNAELCDALFGMGDPPGRSGPCARSADGVAVSSSRTIHCPTIESSCTTVEMTRNAGMR